MTEITNTSPYVIHNTTITEAAVIMAVSFIHGGNRSTREKLMTYRKSLTSRMTYVHLVTKIFFDIAQVQDKYVPIKTDFSYLRVCAIFWSFDINSSKAGKLWEAWGT